MNPNTGMNDSPQGKLMTRTHRHNTRSLPNTPRMPIARRGNLLVGCGVVLLVFILLLGIGTYFVMTNWRGWTASTSTKVIDKMLTESNMDPVEHAEIMVHVEGLMQRFEDKDITVDQLGNVVEKLAKSPVIPAAMVLGIDSYYFEQSDLEQAEKEQGRTDLARFIEGLFGKSIEPNAMNDVLAPVVTNTPDDNDIRLNLTIDPNNGRTITALRSADEVTSDELRELISIAKAKADEAEITQTPAEIDLSDEIEKAIGIALGEIEPDAIEDTIDDAAEDAADDTPATDHGP